MLQDLGDVYQGQDLLYKPWPSCGLSHSYVHAARKLLVEHNVKVEDLKSVDIRAGDGQMELCEPFEFRVSPRTSADAKFSIPYTLAVTLLRGTVTPKDFLPEALRDPAVQSLAKKFRLVQDSSQSWTGNIPLGAIDVDLNDGRRISVIGDDVPGSDEAPMSWDDLVEKFTALARSSLVGLSDEDVARLVAMVAGIDQVEDIAVLSDHLAGRAR